MQLRLKELREDLCLSVGQMAKETGVSQNTIHLYERGGYPSIKQIEMIAKTYDVNPAWLVGWIDGEMMPGSRSLKKWSIKRAQRQDCRIISTTITKVRLSSGSSHEDIEGVGIEEIKRRRPQNIRQRTFQISKHSTDNRFEKARTRNSKSRFSKWAQRRNKQTYRNHCNQNSG